MRKRYSIQLRSRASDLSSVSQFSPEQSYAIVNRAVTSRLRSTSKAIELSEPSANLVPAVEAALFGHRRLRTRQERPNYGMNWMTIGARLLGMTALAVLYMGPVSMATQHGASPIDAMPMAPIRAILERSSGTRVFSIAVLGEPTSKEVFVSFCLSELRA